MNNENRTKLTTSSTSGFEQHERPSQIFSRFLPAALFLVIAVGKIMDLVSYLGKPEMEKGRLFLCTLVASRISVTLFLSLNVVLFVVRLRPLDKATGLKPRVTAILGALMISGLTLLPRNDSSIGQMILATGLILVGNILSVAAIGALGRSFSIMAEARRLVSGGFYSVVRHPLYMSEAIASAGLVLQFFSIYSVLLFIIYIYLQIQRMKNEEEVLRRVFPEYDLYRLKTAMLIPGVY